MATDDKNLMLTDDISLNEEEIDRILNETDDEPSPNSSYTGITSPLGSLIIDSNNNSLDSISDVAGNSSGSTLDDDGARAEYELFVQSLMTHLKEIGDSWASIYKTFEEVYRVMMATGKSTAIIEDVLRHLKNSIDGRLSLLACMHLQNVESELNIDCRMFNLSCRC